MSLQDLKATALVLLKIFKASELIKKCQKREQKSTYSWGNKGLNKPLCME